MRGAGRGPWAVGARAAVLLGAVALVAAAVVPIEARLTVGTNRPPPSAPVLDRLYAADSLAAIAVARDVFRFDRRAATVAYDPGRAALPVERPPRPVLVLVGIVSASEPTAVLEGLPGVPGARVVRVGDEVGGLRIRRIDRHEVGVTGLDTAWTLTVREPWR